MQSRISLISGLNAQQLGDRLRAAVDEIGANKRVLSFYLLDMDERRLYLTTGHGSTAHFGAAQLELDARRVREYLQAGRSLRNLPLLDEAFLDARISWSRLLALLPIMQVETQAAWVEFATEHSLSDLRRALAGCKPGDLPGDGIEDSGDYSLIHKHRKMFLEFTDVEYSQIDQLRMLMAKTTEEGEAKLLSDEELYLELVRAAISQRGGEPNASPTEDRTESQPRATPNQDEIPDEIREHVLRRDRHCCRNCQKPYDISIHHIRFRSRGGSNHAFNLLTLCNTCHSSVHRGLLLITGNPESKTLTLTSASGTPINRGDRSPQSLPEPPPRPAIPTGDRSPQPASAH